MRQTVLLLGTSISDLLGIESDRLCQKFGQDVRLLGCPNPESGEYHARNVRRSGVDAVYIPKNAFDRASKVPIEPLISGCLETVPHYAYANVDDTQNVLLLVTMGSGELTYDVVDI